MAKSTTSTFIWTVPLKYNDQQKNKLDIIFKNACQIYNALNSDRIKAKNNLEHQKAYKDIKNNIASVGAKLREQEEIENQAKENKDKETEDKAKKDIKKLKSEQSDLYKQRNDMIKEAGMTEYAFMARVRKYREHFKIVIPSKIATGVASQVWKKFNLYFYGDKSGRKVKQLRFKPVHQFKSIESGVYNSAVVFERIKDNEPEEIKEKYIGRIRIGKYVTDILVPMPESARDEEALLGNRIKYIRIFRMPMKSGVVYKAQFVMEGFPPLRINREDGELTYPLGEGKVGIDIGLRIVAVATNDTVRLYELAPNSDNPEKEAARLHRAMDRSRRANNPWFFDQETGRYLSVNEVPEEHLRIVNGKKKRIWVNSKNYLNLQRRYRYIMAKAARIRKMEQEILANEILTLGDEFYIENVDFSKFAQKKPQQKKEDLKPGEKFKSRKNAGKTISNRAPAQFVSILKTKVLRQGGTFIEVDPVSTKITMYNHMLDDYCHQSLSQRWDKMPNGDKVQRNMYNAFLLQHLEPAEKKGVVINRKACIQDYDSFYRLELEEVNRLQHVKMPSSSGIKYVGPEKE